MRKQNMMLRDLECPSCAGKLEKAVGNLPGVQSVSVAFGTATMKVEYDETQTGESQIRKVVEQMGMEVATVLSGARG